MQGSLEMTKGRMKIAGFRLVAATACLAIATGLGSTAMANNNKTVEAAVAAGIVGVAVGAALSHKHQHDPVIYYQGYQPYYPAGGYNAYYNQTIRPASNVICYPAQRVCYNSNGSVANKWSRRVFGY